MSKLADIIKPKYGPLAIYYTPEKPDYAEQAGEGHCIIPTVLFPCLKEQKAVYLGKDDIHCPGAVSGLGFGPEPDREEYIVKCSVGTETSPGRHVFESPEIARAVMEQVKVYDNTAGYVVFEPLDDAIGRGAKIESVVFLVDPARLSAMGSLACYSRKEVGSPIKMIHAFACEELYAIPRDENDSDDPKAILGLTELGIRRFCSDSDMTLSLPYKLFLRMEGDVEKSFLTGKMWSDLASKNDSNCCCEKN